jgi:protein PsiE
MGNHARYRCSGQGYRASLSCSPRTVGDKRNTRKAATRSTQPSFPGDPSKAPIGRIQLWFLNPKKEPSASQSLDEKHLKDTRPPDGSRNIDGSPADGESGFGKTLLARGLFHVIERILLVIIVTMTLTAVSFEILAIYRLGEVSLADILLMFLYLEVIGMVSVYYARRNSVFVYPIFIAITAVGRLVVLQGKEMEPVNILIEAAAILLLSISALVIVWAIGQQAARLHSS